MDTPPTLEDEVERLDKTLEKKISDKPWYLIPETRINNPHVEICQLDKKTDISLVKNHTDVSYIKDINFPLAKSTMCVCIPCATKVLPNYSQSDLHSRDIRKVLPEFEFIT